MTAEAFPLQWPHGRPRTNAALRERARFDTGLGVARDGLLHELRMLGAKNIVLSSNLALRNDGLPRAGQPEPSDPAVAVYFTHKQREMSFACDRWDRVRDNMRGIEKTIEALRGIARWGTGDMIEAAFTGFLALPAPTGVSSQHWSIVLGLQAHLPTDEVEKHYRQQRSNAHRDNDTDRFMAINKAYEQFRTERGLT